MTRSEFSGQFDRLCKGFKLDATAEQAEAWFRRISHAHLSDWSEAVTTLLCGRYFPKLDDALEEIEQNAEHRRRTAVRQEARQAEKVVYELSKDGDDPSRIPLPGTALFACIKSFAGRDQVRRYQAILIKQEDLDPKEKQRVLREYGQREAQLTTEIEGLIEKLYPDDIRRLLNTYEEEPAA